MRVLMISKACIVGAYQRKLEEIATCPGISLTVVVPPRWREAGTDQRLELAHTRGYEILILPIVLSGHHHLHWYPRLGNVMRQVRPDLVHIDEEPYNLVTGHAVWLAQHYRARCLFFTWQNIYRDYPPPFGQVERYVYRHVAGAIAGNGNAAAVIQRKGFRKAVTVIPQFGVDPTTFAPPATQRPQESKTSVFRIGYAGRLVPEKGVMDLLPALAQLLFPWELHIAGSGPLAPELQQQARTLDLSEHLCLDGSQPSGRMPGWLHTLDVLVLPSRTRSNWKEQFGRVLPEAMACGVPVIGSDSGEIPQVIGDAGLVFPEGDLPALTSLLTCLYRDPALRAELSQRGRARALSHFTHAHIAAATCDWYQTLAHGEAASGP
ncbi:MAG: glycosyltransferase family 1 protein [Chloroflexi bacterium]|nr:glycosyltransferase family 1 protein [Chloroflexota bacterium]